MHISMLGLIGQLWSKSVKALTKVGPNDTVNLEEIPRFHSNDFC